MSNTSKRNRSDLDFPYLAGLFDVSGSLPQQYWRGPRLRFGSYDRKLLENIRRLLGVGVLLSETRAKGKYHRLDVEGVARVREVLTGLQPHVRVKRGFVEKWLTDLNVKG